MAWKMSVICQIFHLSVAFIDQVILSVADLHCKILNVPFPVQIFGKFWQNSMLAPPGG